MSAQYLVSFNGTQHVEILSGSEQPSAATSGSGESSTKQREAVYYIVAVIVFYALTFMVLFCKYARFKKKEVDETISYFPLPSDIRMTPSTKEAVEDADHVALRKFGQPGTYGTSDVTPKVMRVKLLPHWLCRREETKACDV